MACKTSTALFLRMRDVASDVTYEAVGSVTLLDEPALRLQGDESTSISILYFRWINRIILSNPEQLPEVQEYFGIFLVEANYLDNTRAGLLHISS